MVECQIGSHQVQTWSRGFGKKILVCRRVRSQLKEGLDSGFVSSWLTKGRINLLQKDKSESNYKPITCLPLMWKLLLGVIADQIYGHLDQQKLLPEEQKGCRKRSRGTNDLLYIDRVVIRDAKSRKKEFRNSMERL